MKKITIVLDNDLFYEIIKETISEETLIEDLLRDWIEDKMIEIREEKIRGVKINDGSEINS